MVFKINRKKLNTSGINQSSVRRFLRRSISVIWVTFAALGVLEIIFRYYWFDFYNPELQGLNTTALLQPADSTLLVFGDSFTAHPGSYVAVLRDSMPHWRIINSAVPGTGSEEMSRMAPSRIRQFAPKKVLFQLYVGNDLMDIQHPINWGQLPFLRNAYWTIADQMEIIDFLNFRFAHVRHRLVADTKSDLQPQDTASFTPEKYNSREKLYLRADPDFMVNSVLARGNGCEKSFQILVQCLQKTIQLLPKDCQISILVIPHCAQVNDFYAHNMTIMGMRGSDGLRHYLFLENLKAIFSNTPIRILDALPVLQASDSPKSRVFYENDIHCTPFGQRVIGEWLSNNYFHLSR